MKPKTKPNEATEMAIKELRDSGEWGRLVEFVRADVDVEDKRSYVENAIREHMREFRVSDFCQAITRGKFKYTDVDVAHIALLIFQGA